MVIKNYLKYNNINIFFFKISQINCKVILIGVFQITLHLYGTIQNIYNYTQNVQYIFHYGFKNYKSLSTKKY